MILPSERMLPRLFLILLLAVLALAGWQWRNGAPLSANLMELVPGTSPDALELIAEQRMQEPLNREVLVLVGHTDRQQAIALAQTLGEQWQASGLFDKVQWTLQADLPALRAQLLNGRLAMLSAADREQLIEQPQAFIQQRVQALFDPFSGFSLVPNQDDWLGLTGRIQNSQPQRGAIKFDIGSGALVADADGRATADPGDFPGRLLLAFRRLRVWLAFVPVLVGVLFGAVACVALFGRMHVMTLVLGSSLIGVAVDYPLHYLSKSWSLKPWRSWPALRLTLPGLSLSLVTTCIGYLALAWTPFPALTQIAIFSAAGLVGAYLSAVCLLPALLKGAELRPAQWPLQVCQYLLKAREALLKRVRTPVLLMLLLTFCAGGLWHLTTKNDIRQWIGTPQHLTDEARDIARITGCLLYTSPSPRDRG